MRELLKGCISVLIHFAAGFICCVLYVFIFEEPAVLPQFLLRWKLSESGLLFIRILPGLLVSSILIGYAVIFGICGHNTLPRYSAILLRYLRDVFIILCFCITAYIVLVEITSPALLKYRLYSELKTHDYYDFLKAADSALKKNLFDEAYTSSKAALGIWQESEEAAKILETAKVLVEDKALLRQEQNAYATEEQLLFPDNLTPEGALFISKRFMAMYDFYTAHFYALQSYKLSPENGPYREEAIRIAAQAWNNIEKGLAELKVEFDIQLYQAKKAGYEMMQQGNYIKAYYQFADAQRMLEKHNPLKRDPDIDRFVEITRKKLLETVFFIDEFETLSIFESVKHIHFTVPASGIMPAVKVSVEGLSFISNSGVQELYGRNCEITQYSRNDKVLFKCRVPFVKFIPIVDTDRQSKIRMQLQAVDRRKDEVITRPLVLEGALPAEQLSSMLLPFSYSDFELIVAACEGEKTMTLPQLYRFRSIGSVYGFSAKIYHREILSRVSDILLILIISIYILVLAWGFRVPPHQRFSGGWLLSFPLFFVGISFFVETIRYCARLMIVFLTDTAYPYSTFLVSVTYIILFIGVSFLFFAQRSEV